MSSIYSFVNKSTEGTIKKIPEIPSVKEFDQFIETMRIMITKDESVFRRDIDINSLSNVYVHLRDSEKFMNEYLHVNFPEIESLEEIEVYPVERFEDIMRSSLSTKVLFYIDILYGDETNSEKMRIYKNRVLSMKFLREFYRGKDFDMMDHVIDDLEDLINDLMNADDEEMEIMFSSDGSVVEKGKLPRSTNLEGYNWRSIFHESRRRNRRNNGINMEGELQLNKVQERAREKNKALDQRFSDVTRGDKTV